jgi:1-deoxy-D-xylulose-5-phosphate reductoisomerase
VKTLSILGSTGSIGVQTLDVVAAHPDQFSLAWLTTNTRIDTLEEQTRRFKPHGVVIADEAAYKEFKRTTSFQGQILCGDEAVCEAAADTRAELLMSALVGFSGVLPTHEAISRGITIALANKETLVSAGSVIMQAARQHGVKILAVDSEHSAILQCLVGERESEIEKLILTASGGPFREYSAAELQSVTRAQALKHPNWSMGAKITIDSATMMNKGFEVIEAYWLFGLGAEHIEVVVHPQSIIHSMVQFVDGSVKAQLGLPDMKIPIAYALSFPQRMKSEFPRMNLSTLKTLTFCEPDVKRFPCLRLAFDALHTGGTAPAVVNAANEIAVAAFLQEHIRFMDIPRLIERALESLPHLSTPSLAEIVQIDSEARAFTRLAITGLR